MNRLKTELADTMRKYRRTTICLNRQYRGREPVSAARLWAASRGETPGGQDGTAAGSRRQETWKSRYV
jgi:hypothetical protein